MDKKLAVVSHSGGLDSTTLLAYKLSQGYHVMPVNIKYGQRNAVEVFSQKNIIDYYKKIYPDQLDDTVNIDLTPVFESIQGTIDGFRQKGYDNPKLKDLNEYFPNRNMLFLAFTGVFGELFAYKEKLPDIEICLGIHKHTTYINYWDIKPDFAHAMKAAFELNDALDVRVDTPFVEQTKEDITRLMKDLDVPYKLTWTCYTPVEKEKNAFVPCQKCPACIERAEHAGKYVSDINDYSVRIKE